MKKITLIASAILSVLSLTMFAQDSYTINNPEDLTQVKIGEDLTINLSWDVSQANPADRLEFICVWLREFDDFNSPVNNYGDFQVCPVRGPEGNFTAGAEAGSFVLGNDVETNFEFTVDTSKFLSIDNGAGGRTTITEVPLSSTLPTDHRYELVIGLATQAFAFPGSTAPEVEVNSAGDMSNGQVIEVVETLSVNDFAKDNISAAISQKDGIVTIADTVETEDYKLYDMTGALVIEKEADGILDINGLPNGVYILSTDAGLTKIGK